MSAETHGKPAAQPIQIEWEPDTKYDESNPLIRVKSKKDKSDKKPAAKAKSKPLVLSKKQRKKLEKIVERRSKKKNRAEILEELQKHQLPQEVFQNLTPLIKVQNEGLRKLYKPTEQDDEDESNENDKKIVKSKGSLRGANRRRFQQLATRKRPLVKDLNVLGFDSSSSSSSVEESSDDEESGPVAVPILSSKPNVTLAESPTEIEIDKNEVSLDIVNTTINVEDEPPTPARTSVPDKLITQPKPLVPITKTPPAPSRKSCFVHVDRSEEINQTRSKLPIIAEEHVIMEAISENSVVVLAGETGCGKTTQVPQFLYEAGYALGDKLIGITEPRRVAAMAMSARVGKELNLSKDVVSYQIRFEGNATTKTKIKFMTDGVLLKEMEKDFLLKKYSAICVDEAHERSLYTDILIGLLSRCVLIREKRGDPLKVIIMSATLKAEDFTKNSKLFKKPPAFIHVPARQFPVQVHFSKVTAENYMESARKRIVAIHTKLPPGGILVFVTGQLEVKILSNKLDAIQAKSEHKSQKLSIKKKISERKGDSDPKVIEFDLDKVGYFPYENESNEENSSDEEEDGDEELLSMAEPLHIVPLYSMLPMKQQQKVFRPPPAGSRLCVISTNIAETSLTIPGIRYVVDCGKVKEKKWDKLTGIQTFDICWCSKASAQQRTGRAGRTGPGHCYRLYSSAVYNHEFPEFSKPEIQNRPVDDMMLLMKSMSITKVRNFPYPTRPDPAQLLVAEKLLILLGALELPPSSTFQQNADTSFITSLGKTMAHLPISPRFSKMIAISFAHSVLGYIITLVAALTVQEVLLEVQSENESHARWAEMRRKWAGTKSSNLLGDCKVLLAAVKEFEGGDGSAELSFKLGLRHKAMLEIRKLRKQLTNEIAKLTNNESLSFVPQFKLPNEEESVILRQILLSGFPDKIAKKLNRDELTQKKLKNNAYWCGEVEEPAFIHSASVLKSSKPEYLVFQEAFEISGKVYLRGITAIEEGWIADVCPNNDKFTI